MDLLAESITEVAVSGEIANTDRVLNIAYGIDRNFFIWCGSIYAISCYA
nr:hypothetical protein [Escherichia coli]